MDYQEINETVDVPKNTGTKGFLRAIEDILKKSRVQSIEIDARGKISYRRFVRPGEEIEPLKTDFETLTPYMAIRNGTAVELAEPSVHAPTAIGQLFDRAAADHLFPIAFVGGASTWLWDWYKRSTKFDLSSREELFGLPFLADRHVPDETLVLGAAFARDAALIDIQKSYKIVIPQVKL